MQQAAVPLASATQSQQQQQQQQLPQPQPPPQPQQPGQVTLCELRPSVASNVHTTFIILEKGQTTKTSEGAPLVCVALVADPTASVHLQLWGQECEAFQPSDIVRFSNGLFSCQKGNMGNMVLRAGKRGTLEKIGQFSMVFVESPNMSRVTWVPDPSSPKLFMPVGVGTNSSSPQPHGMLPNNFRGYH